MYYRLQPALRNEWADPEAGRAIARSDHWGRTAGFFTRALQSAFLRYFPDREARAAFFPAPPSWPVPAVAGVSFASPVSFVVS